MDRDDSQALIDAVRDACAARSTLYLAGAGSKRTPLAGACAAAPLDVTAHRGIVSYRADELVLTARAGTPVADLVSAAAAQGQRLPFEPLQSAGATLGGTVATGLSGPARPWRGGVRDAVLGLRLINGQAQHLRFGGEVMKNVAGYDVSRLQCGALGAYGVISEVSLRLLPRLRAKRVCAWR
jgi:glycolate oxidase FAD binding subunit